MAETPDLVRAILEAWNRRDMEAVGQHLQPDFEWVEHDEGLSEGPVVTGAAALAEIAAGLEENLSEYRAEVVEVVEIDTERAIAVTRETGHGSVSGAPFSTEFGYVVTVRDGKAIRIEAYRDPRDAFAAVGQSDEGSGA